MNEEHKAIKEYLEALPTPYNRIAVRYTTHKKLKRKVASHYLALVFAFDWRSTKEGYNFWEKIAKQTPKNKT